MSKESSACITAATIYMVCKQCDVVRSLEEICREIVPVKDVKSNSLQQDITEPWQLKWSTSSSINHGQIHLKDSKHDTN